MTSNESGPPPPTGGGLGPKAVLDAQRQGYDAALSGAGIDSCPWARAVTATDKVAREAWVRGYASGRAQCRPAEKPPSG